MMDKVKFSGDFRFPVKLNFGAAALDSIPFEFDGLGASAPLCVTGAGRNERAAARRMMKAFAGSDLAVKGMYRLREGSAGGDAARGIMDEFSSRSCDSFLIVGAGETVEAVKRAVLLLGGRIPMVLVLAGEIRGGEAVPAAAQGSVRTAVPDLVVGDTRLWKYMAVDALRERSRKVHAAAAEYLADPRAGDDPLRAAWADAALRCASAAADTPSAGVIGSILHDAVSEMPPAPAETAPEGEPAALSHLPGYFEFTCPARILSGHEELEKIPDLLREMGVTKPLLITDRGVGGAGLVKILLKALAGKVVLSGLVDTVPPDSDIETVNGIAAEYRSLRCDSIIALGGGSVLDTAKGVNIVVSEGVDDLMEMAGAGRINHPLKPLVAVPTTAGTGSEVTLVAVVADHRRKKKVLFTSPFIIPAAAVLDSRMTLSLPPLLTGITGMDALTHAVEAYTCLGKNPVSDAQALKAVELISRHLVPVMKNPADREGRLALARAANLAGSAFSNSMVGMVHSLGHSVGGVCGVPHGVCMAILLPFGLEYNLHKNGTFTGELLLPLAGRTVYDSTPSGQRAAEFISRIRALNQELHELTEGRHGRYFQELKDRDGNPAVPEAVLPEIACTALGDGSIFYNPGEMDFEDALRVLKASFFGSTLKSVTPRQTPL